MFLHEPSGFFRFWHGHRWVRCRRWWCCDLWRIYRSRIGNGLCLLRAGGNIRRRSGGGNRFRCHVDGNGGGRRRRDRHDRGRQAHDVPEGAATDGKNSEKGQSPAKRVFTTGQPELVALPLAERGKPIRELSRRLYSPAHGASPAAKIGCETASLPSSCPCRLTSATLRYPAERSLSITPISVP